MFADKHLHGLIAAMTSRLKLCLVMVVAACCGSCREAPEMVRQCEQQEQEITELNIHIEQVRQRLRSLPRDLSGDLAAAERELEGLQQETEQLDAEIASLQEKKYQLKKEFASYRLNYPIN